MKTHNYKIYKLQFPDDPRVYIGHTRCTFKSRYSSYRSDAKKRKSPIPKDEFVLRWYYNDVEMVEIDNITSNDLREVKLLEQKHLNDHPDNFNKFKAFLSVGDKIIKRDKWYQDNKEDKEDYYKMRNDLIAESRKEYDRQRYLNNPNRYNKNRLASQSS